MYRNLNAEISRRGLTRERLAELMGMPKATLSNKLNGRASLTLPEVKKIKRILNDISSLKGMSIDVLFEEEFERCENPEPTT